MDLFDKINELLINWFNFGSETMWTIKLFLLLGVTCCSSAEVFTAMADMEALLHTEGAVTLNLKQFIQVEEDRIKELKRYVVEIFFQISVNPKYRLKET